MRKKAIKIQRCLNRINQMKQLERLYGIQNGGSGYYGNQYEEVGNNCVAPKTQ